ncbi:Uncharacterised protein [Bordetella pertussis]|nr:Uncharacterised protein [Bordetella pertussis]
MSSTCSRPARLALPDTSSSEPMSVTSRPCAVCE